MISLLISLLVLLVVLYVVNLIIGSLALPPNVKAIAFAIIGLVFLLYVLRSLGLMTGVGGL